MSRYLDKKYQDLVPYVPGEQPKENVLIKLNTNESPFEPSPEVQKVINNEAIRSLRRYNDPTNSALNAALAKTYGVKQENVCSTGGSDEMLDYAFMAYGQDGIAFADITYGFYQVFCDLRKIPSTIIPLRDDFSIRVEDYEKLPMAIVIANPNAPTGLALSPKEIQQLLETHKNHVVIVDEAYGDFAEESMIPYIGEYDNLLVVRTFSKSRCLAGARIGYAIGNKKLIDDLERIRNSCNPYDVTTLSQLAGIAALEDTAYFESCTNRIKKVRDTYYERYLTLGFEGPKSESNFLFLKHPKVSGETVYKELRKRGILVRHFSKERIGEYNRITVGTEEQMKRLEEALKEILYEKS